MNEFEWVNGFESVISPRVTLILVTAGPHFVALVTKTALLALFVEVTYKTRRHQEETPGSQMQERNYNQPHNYPHVDCITFHMQP